MTTSKAKVEKPDAIFSDLSSTSTYAFNKAEPRTISSNQDWFIRMHAVISSFYWAHRISSTCVRALVNVQRNLTSFSANVGLCEISIRNTKVSHQGDFICDKKTRKLSFWHCLKNTKYQMLSVVIDSRYITSYVNMAVISDGWKYGTRGYVSFNLTRSACFSSQHTLFGSRTYHAWQMVQVSWLEKNADHFIF